MRRLVTCLFLSLSILPAGCGDDDGGDGADAAPPDAPPRPDGPDAGIAPPPPNYVTTNCSAGPDAAPVPDSAPLPDVILPDANLLAPDAAPTPDAPTGPPPGVGDPCCDEDGDPGACMEGQVCLTDRRGTPGDTTDDVSSCRTRCTSEDSECPQPGRCVGPFSDGQGVCFPAGMDGDMCSPEFCAAGFACVGSSAEDAVCRTCCTSSDDCEGGQTCAPLSGSNPPCPMACIPL